MNTPAFERVAKLDLVQKLSIFLTPNLKQVPEKIKLVAVQIDATLQIILLHKNLRVLDLEQNRTHVVLRALDEVHHFVELVQRDCFCSLLQVLFGIIKLPVQHMSPIIFIQFFDFGRGCRLGVAFARKQELQQILPKLRFQLILQRARYSAK